MSRMVDFSTTAQRDVAQAAEFIRQDSPRSALRFVDAVQTTAARLLNMPALGGLYGEPDPDLAELRVLPVPGFEKYLLFYQPGAEGIEVVRVLHGARDIGKIFGDN